MASNTPRIDALEASRNMVINGNFDYWQRGTSAALSTVITPLADRWLSQISAGYSGTQSRSTDVPTVAESGFQSRYSLLITNGTGTAVGTNNFHDVWYKMEGQDYQAIHGGKPARLQFWVKSSVAGMSSITLANQALNRANIVTYTINQANTWEKKTIDFVTDDQGTWNFDNQLGLNFIFNLSAGTNFQAATFNHWRVSNGSGAFYGAVGQSQLGVTTGSTWQIAQVQVIPGDYTGSTVDIPFSRVGKTIGDELAMCQRYYEKSYNHDVLPGTIGADGHTSHVDLADSTSSTIGIRVPLKVSKRQDIVSITFYNRNSGVTGSWESNRSTAGTLVLDANVNVTSSGSTENSFGVNATGSIALTVGDAVRLYGHWAVNAELP